ncbi:MAG TPA: SusC/RagA family TonB-linked outer membrane protein, partial [Paludibacter sp.]
MRNTLILLFIGVLQVHAIDTYSQKTRLSLNFSDTQLTKVLDKIESESEFFFLYNEKLLNIDRKVNITENDQLITVILADLFAGTNVKYTIIDRKIILAPDYLTSQPQQKQITGKVTDESGNPLPGANIQVEGTTTGVISDASGKYSINIPNDNAVLIFSFIGYNAMKVSAIGKTTINMTLVPNIANLEEVVVVGYGTAKRSDLTGSVVRANMSTLDGSPNVSALQALHGTVPGLNVGVTTQAGADPSISIRGLNSLSGSTSPLIVLDGIIYRGSIVDINPKDIESIDVLKDASSTAIYGSQASNGVLIITTKTAKEISKPVIEYSSSFSIQSLTNKDMLPLDSKGFIQHLSDAELASSRTGTDMLQPNPNFDVTKYFGDATLIDGYNNGTNTNWFKLLSNNIPYIQDHNLSVRGKNELASYFLSVGYTDQKNLIINDTYKRYNVRVNLETKITNWFKVGTQSFFTESNMSGVQPSFSSLMLLPPLSSPYDANGNLLVQTYKGTINPLLMIQNPDLDKRYNISGNFYADINVPFIKGLNYRMNFSQNLVIANEDNFNPYANTLLGSAYKNNSTYSSWTLDNIVTYKRDFGLHDINATLVYGVEKRASDATTATANNFVNQTLGYNYLAAGTSNLNVLGSSAWEESSLYSMGRLVYMYNNRYILTGTLRRDGFSGFGEKNKIGYFPSVALAWKLSEEDFVKNNVSWINSLKLRMSYGTNGNRTVGRYATLAKMSTQNPLGTGYSPIAGGYLYGDGVSPELTQAVSTMSNANLKWETTTAFNTGLDFSVLKNRLFGNIEFYRSETKNLLYNVSIPNINGMFPDASGNNGITVNIGKLQNIGEEFSITGVPVRTSDFEWNL